jgi:hypothetical protein
VQHADVQFLTIAAAAIAAAGIGLARRRTPIRKWSEQLLQFWQGLQCLVQHLRRTPISPASTQPSTIHGNPPATNFATNSPATPPMIWPFFEAVAQNLANFYNMSLHDGAFAAGGIVADHCPQYEPNLEAAKNYAEKNDLWRFAVVLVDESVKCLPPFSGADNAVASSAKRTWLFSASLAYVLCAPLVAFVCCAEICCATTYTHTTNPLLLALFQLRINQLINLIQAHYFFLLDL